MPSRRTFLATAGSGLLASAAGCLSPATDRDVSGSWTHVGRTPDRSSHAPDGTAPEPPLTTRWMHDFDGDFISSPVVADGSVYVARIRYDYPDDGVNALVVAALDAGTSEVVWESPGIGVGEQLDGYRDSIAVADGTVYVFGRAALVALDTRDGSKRWRLPTPTRWPLRGNQHPAVVDGVVYSGTFGAPDAPESVFAVDAADGSVRWEWTANDYPSATLSIPAVADGTVCTALTDREDGVLVALDAETGEKEWLTEAPLHTPVAVGGDRVVVSTAEETGENNKDLFTLRSFDIETGNEQWQQQTGPTAFCEGAAVDSKHAYQPTFDGLYAHDLSTGEVVWTAERENDMTRTTPAVVDGTVFVPDGELFRAFDTETGDELARPHIAEGGGESLDSAPAVVDGLAFVTTSYDRIYAIESCTLGGGRYCLF